MRTAAGLTRRIVSVLIDGNYAGGNIFENRFHQRAAALQFLHGLLQVLREHINLAAAVAQLLGHPVEGTHQRFQFILRLHVDARLEIARDDFLRRLAPAPESAR